MKALEITLTVTALIVVTSDMMWFRLWRHGMRGFTLSMLPGYQVAARYGADTVEFQTAVSRSRFPYSTIHAVTFHESIAVLTTNRASMYPSQLVPDRALAHMIERNPRIVVKR
ncbi:hypothetical protein [Nocardia sp. NPDC046763]|uniref:hypothetical protein n=1 Tax=Nocardia sp. NPDC046763 TaxID=3155256 RepID=UPI0033D04AA3